MIETNNPIRVQIPLFAILLFFFSCNAKSGSIKKEFTEGDVKTLFVNKANNFVKSYESNNRLKVTELGGGWCKVNYKINPNISYDIQKTNSIVSPYKAILKFRLLAYRTEFHKSEEESKLDNNISFNPFEERIHTHVFDFKDNEWIIVKRTNQKQVSGIDDFISNCDEVIQTGSQSGNTNLFGCWEIE